MSSDFLIGQTVRIPLTVTELSSNDLSDPSGITLKIRKPDQTLIVLTYGTDDALVKQSTGHYHADQVLNQPGNWLWRWEATAPNAGAVEGKLHVQASRVL